MDAIVYIDGYNLYYGRLKDTPYKWFDIVKLFTNICHIQNPNSNIIRVKYFTAPVLARFLTNGATAVASQNNYIRALETLYPNSFEVIKRNTMASCRCCFYKQRQFNQCRFTLPTFGRKKSTS